MRMIRSLGVISSLAVLMVPGRAGSLERLPVSPNDVSAALGIDVSKFAFRFEKPVYGSVQLQVKVPGLPAILIDEPGDQALRRHEFAFTIKDRTRLREALGFAAPAPDKSLLFSVLSPGVRFDYESADPFAGDGGRTFYTYRPVRSREALPLNQPIPVFIKFGPLSLEQAAAVKSAKEEFVLAPAFVHVAVVFSEKPPAPRLDTPVFPLKVSTSGRHLVDQNGTPFLYHADTPWRIFWKLTKDEAARYLDARAARGFSAIQAQVLPEGCGPGDSNADGEPFLLAPFDLSQPNEKFFDHVEWVIREAGRRGLLVTLNPAWLGCCEGGWRDHLKAHGVEKCAAYGRWLGTRFKALDNVMWLHGGDRDAGEWRPFVNAIAEAIKAAAPQPLHAAHAASTHSALDDYPTEKWLDVNTTYTYSTDHAGAWTRQFHVYARSRDDYRRMPPRPFFLVESTYELEHKAPAQKIRRQAWWSVLSGSCGQAFGNGRIWRFDPGWKEELDSRGSHDMEVLARVLRACRWWELVPDFDHRIVTAGRGTFNESNEPGGDDYATVAATPDARTVVGYFPAPRKIEFTGGGRLMWIDPCNGESRADNGSLEPPGKNSSGDADWVLLIQR